MPKSSIFRLISYWPPFLVSGIQVKEYTESARKLRVEMRLRFWNWNHERSHFGGSLYSMTDPYYALLIRENVLDPVEVWVKSASIRFLRPGRGTVEATFQLTDEKLKEIEEDLLKKGKSEPQFEIKVKNKEGKLIASVEQVVFVRKKSAH